MKLFFRQTLLLAGGLAAGLAWSAVDRGAADRPRTWASTEAKAEIARLTTELDQAKTRLERTTAIARYSAIYRIPADLAERVYDAALAEGLHPSLGLQLVKVESGFQPNARSTKGAIGLTQVRLSTAREVDPALTEHRLLDPTTNLRIGFRVLRRLLDHHHHDLEFALRAYNLGAAGARAAAAIADSTDQVVAGSGYASAVMRGLKRTRRATAD